MVRALDSGTKGLGFESWQEQHENFLLQAQLSVLTLFRYQFYLRVTAVTRKRSWSSAKSAGGMLQLNTYTWHLWLIIKWCCNLVLGCIVYGVHRTCTRNSTWQTEVHQRACEDHYFVGCLDQCCVLYFADCFFLCVSVTDCSWPTILISVCLCDWLQLAYYTYFWMSLWLTAVDLLYLFLCVSVTDCSWPTIPISVCLCDWLQLAYYTYFCVSLWLIAVGLLYLFLCVSVTDCSWPTIPISVSCDRLQLTYYTYFCVSLWQIAFDLLYLFLYVSVTAVGPCPRVPHPGDRQQVSTVSVQTSPGAAG